MKRMHRAALAVLLAGVAVGVAGDLSAAPIPLSAITQRCDRLDRAAADLVRSVEGAADYDRAQDTALVADLTAFRTYVRALKDVVEQSRGSGGGFGARRRQWDAREAQRQLCLRLRNVADLVEFQVAQQNPNLMDSWKRTMRTDLDPLVELLLSREPIEVVVLPPPPPPPPPPDRPPAGFTRVTGAAVFTVPDTVKGDAKYIRIETWGGDLTVKTVKYTITEIVWGYLTFENERERRVERSVRPGEALLVEVDRGASANVSKVSLDVSPPAGRSAFVRVTLADRPD
jgi:hypothetical protein